MIFRKSGDSVRETGSASASEGGFANTGHIGTLNMHAVSGAAVRSSYQEKVRLIAPAELLGREREYAELEVFCTAPDRSPPYLWWRAPAWAGKSALMSWFVLHPPQEVRVVSFFITGRYAGQNDRIAFAEVLIEQVAELLGEPLPPLLSEATREAHLLGMLARAAEACREQGQRLILVVDGLDEDRGVTTGVDAYSIAALLPPDPAAGMRVVVAGRPNPPIPTDVPDGHPLRDPAIVRVLAGSPHAAVVRQDAQRELRRLLTGSYAEQDLLGLLTAAGGGLSGADLAELTGCSRGDIDEELAAVSARTFTPRSGRWQPETTIYVLGHEELQQQASERLGASRLQEYRNRLHTWADGYRDRGWPAGTPEYLLRGYFQLVQAAGDVPRMLALATDSDRHDRMLDITGGDYVALTEVTLTGGAILASGQPDLAAMGRLAAHRYALKQRNSNIPTNLPAVWARLGNPYRAEALAQSLTDPIEQVQALGGVARALAAVGDLAHARRLAENAEALARSLRARYELAEALAWAAEAVAAVGDSAAAEAIARSVTDSAGRSWALAAVAQAVAADDLERARMLAGEAEDLARSVTNPVTQAWATAEVAQAMATAGDPAHAEVLARSIANPYQQVAALAGVAEVVATAGHHGRARRLAEYAESVALTLVHPDGQPPLLDTARAVAASGDPAHAEALARSLTDRYARAEVLAGVASVVATADPARAETLARSIPETEWRGRALSGVAWAVAAAGDLEHARTLAEYAESMARTIVDPNVYGQTLVRVAGAVAAAGDLERAGTLAGQAEALARSVTHPYEQAQALAGVAPAVAAAGDPARAEALACSIPDRHWRARALAGVAGAVAAAGDPAHGRTLTEQVEAIARSDRQPFSQALVLPDIAEAVAAAGDLARAEAIARSLTHPSAQAQALAVVAPAVAAAGDPAHAEALARSIPDLEWKAWTLAGVARAVAAAGDHAHARTLAESAEALAQFLSDPHERAQIMASVAHAVAAAGDPSHAEVIARSIADPDAQASALAAVAMTVPSSRADHLLAEALQSGDLDVGLAALARVKPAAVIALADCLMRAISRTVPVSVDCGTADDQAHSADRAGSTSIR